MRYDVYLSPERTGILESVDRITTSLSATTYNAGRTGDIRAAIEDLRQINARLERCIKALNDMTYSPDRQAAREMAEEQMP